MVRKIDKILAKLSLKEREWVFAIVTQVHEGDTKHLDIKKLKGVNGIYRLRKGDIRVVFKKQADGTFNVIAIDRRGDDTYKNL